MALIRFQLGASDLSLQSVIAAGRGARRGRKKLRSLAVFSFRNLRQTGGRRRLGQSVVSPRPHQQTLIGINQCGSLAQSRHLQIRFAGSFGVESEFRVQVVSAPQRKLL